MLTEGDLTWGAEHTIQDTGDVLDSCTAETYIILLTNVTPINSIKVKNIKIKINKIYYFSVDVGDVLAIKMFCILFVKYVCLFTPESLTSLGWIGPLININI